MDFLLDIARFFLANVFHDCRGSHEVQQIRTLPSLPASLASTNHMLSGFCVENYLPKLFSDLA